MPNKKGRLNCQLHFMRHFSNFYEIHKKFHIELTNRTKTIGISRKVTFTTILNYKTVQFTFVWMHRRQFELQFEDARVLILGKRM